MSNLLDNVLEKIRENNNDYRNELEKFNKELDTLTTTLIGSLVTESNYIIDFSNATSKAFEILTGGISKVVESYVIKDLRSVETVNDQFINKIEIKINDTKISNDDDKQNFISNLSNLLNNKYLEIVKIKRVDFLDKDNSNTKIEEIIVSYNDYLLNSYNFNNIHSFDVYKKDVYDLINKCLYNISNLYLNNFTNNVIDALSKMDVLVDEQPTNENDEHIETRDENEMPTIPDIPASDDIKDNIDDLSINSNVNIPDIPVVPDVPFVNKEETIPDLSSMLNNISLSSESENIDNKDNEIKQNNIDQPKKMLDVDEILKIAKSPVITFSSSSNNNSLSENLEYDEKELATELINRIKQRLEEIEKRTEKIEEEEKHINEDAAFVDNLIESSNKKRKELDELEKSLDDKEKEINNKEEELNKKINDVMPFANAVLNSGKEF